MYLVAEKGKLEFLHTTWEWDKEVLTPEELNNKMFLGKKVYVERTPGTWQHRSAN